jgi:Mrp family chromosome partitioning ATPase
VLQEEASLEQAIKPTPYPNLSVILCGAHDPSHPELLDTDRFSDLLVALGQAYDFILVDSPAVGVFTDAAVLAARLGRVMLVVDATRSGPENERRSLTLLRRTGAAVEGVIVNKISAEYVDPMRLHSLPRHVVDLTHSFGNGNGNGNGHTNGHTNGYANGNGAATNGHAHPAGGPVPPVPEHN